MSIRGLKSVNEPENGVVTPMDVCIECDANRDRCTICDFWDYGEVDCGSCDGWANDHTRP